MRGVLKADKDKKLKHLSVRMTQAQYDKLRACAIRENVPVSSLVANVALDYADKDVDMARQMMASQSRLHADIRRLGDVATLGYNLLYSFIYSFFIANAKECQYEFATAEYTSDKDLLAKGIVHKKNADRVMELFNRKFLSDESVRRCVLANLAGMENRDVPEESKEDAV